MARPLRIEREGGWYHVSSRGNERRAVYHDDRDRRHFCELLGEMVERYRLDLHCYVLMKNHYHLLLSLREVNLSRAIHWLNVSYSVWFNRRWERSGHLFQGRFKSLAVDRQEWGLALSRYIHLNPVRVAGLGLDKVARERLRLGVGDVPDAGQIRRRLALLRRYRWSSYPAYTGIRAQPEWLRCDELLDLGGGPKARQREQYRTYVETAVREGMDKRPWEAVLEQVALGGREFLKTVCGRIDGAAKAGERLKRRLAVRPDWAGILAGVERVKGEKWEAFRERHGDRGRDMALWLGRREGGLTLRELAELAELKSDAAVAVSLKRYAAALRDDPEERDRLQGATELLIVRS